jgi:hypothetical protein
MRAEHPSANTETIGFFETIPTGLTGPRRGRHILARISG